jgi:hypothetical protein
MHMSRINPDTKIPTSDGDPILRTYLEEMQIEEQWDMNVPFYHHYPEDPPAGTFSSRRKLTSIGPRVVYLTSATLVIVPPNLLGQWDQEIHKHCSYPLRVLILRSNTPMPAAAVLAGSYDVKLLISSFQTPINTISPSDYTHDLSTYGIYTYTGI